MNQKNIVLFFVCLYSIYFCTVTTNDAVPVPTNKFADNNDLFDAGDILLKLGKLPFTGIKTVINSFLDAKFSNKISTIVALALLHKAYRLYKQNKQNQPTLENQFKHTSRFVIEFETNKDSIIEIIFLGDRKILEKSEHQNYFTVELQEPKKKKVTPLEELEETVALEESNNEEKLIKEPSKETYKRKHNLINKPAEKKSELDEVVDSFDNKNVQKTEIKKNIPEKEGDNEIKQKIGDINFNVVQDYIQKEVITQTKEQKEALEKQSIELREKESKTEEKQKLIEEKLKQETNELEKKRAALKKEIRALPAQEQTKNLDPDYSFKEFHYAGKLKAYGLYFDNIDFFDNWHDILRALSSGKLDDDVIINPLVSRKAIHIIMNNSNFMENNNEKTICKFFQQVQYFIENEIKMNVSNCYFAGKKKKTLLITLPPSDQYSPDEYILKLYNLIFETRKTDQCKKTFEICMKNYDITLETDRLLLKKYKGINGETEYTLKDNSFSKIKDQKEKVFSYFSQSSSKKSQLENFYFYILKPKALNIRSTNVIEKIVVDGKNNIKSHVKKIFPIDMKPEERLYMSDLEEEDGIEFVAQKKRPVQKTILTNSFLEDESDDPIIKNDPSTHSSEEINDGSKKISTIKSQKNSTPQKIKTDFSIFNDMVNKTE